MKNAFAQFFTTEFNALGQPLKETLPSGVFTDYGYDTKNRLQSLTMKLPSGTPFDQLRYTYTTIGQVASEIDAGNRTHSFTYNLRGELLTEGHPDLGSGIQYTYDANGNRTKAVRNGVNEFYGVDNADRLVWTNGSNGTPTAGQAGAYNLFSYDAFGNLARRDRRDAGGARKIVDFAWDSDGRLRQALDETTGGSLLSATYTADGERVTKTDVPTGGHVFSYGLFDSNASTWYTPGFAQRKGVSGPDRFFHQDWLGSTRYLTDNPAPPAVPTTKAALRYDAYGNQTAYGGTDPQPPTSFAFAGYEREADGSLGLDYLCQRYYDASVGRFISRDPVRWLGGINLYGYCGGDPVNATDRLGLQGDGGGGAPLAILQATTDAFADLSSLSRDPVGYARGLYHAGALGNQWRLLDPGIGAWWELRTGHNLTTGRQLNACDRSDREEQLSMSLVLGMQGGAAEAEGAAMAKWWSRGRLGSVKTRLQIRLIANELERRGWIITHGGERIPHRPEELIPGPLGGRLGSASPDITAVKNGRTLRINTADVTKSGRFTLRERFAGWRIRQRQLPGDHFLMIPKAR